MPNFSTAILLSRARPPRMASIKTSNSYKLTSKQTACGTYLHRGKKATPLICPSGSGQTGGGSETGDTIYYPLFLHSDGITDFSIGLSHESMGTKALFVILDRRHVDCTN